MMAIYPFDLAKYIRLIASNDAGYAIVEIETKIRDSSEIEYWMFSPPYRRADQGICKIKADPGQPNELVDKCVTSGILSKLESPVKFDSFAEVVSYLAKKSNFPKTEQTTRKQAEGFLINCSQHWIDYLVDAMDLQIRHGIRRKEKDDELKDLFGSGWYVNGVKKGVAFLLDHNKLSYERKVKLRQLWDLLEENFPTQQRGPFTGRMS